MAIMTPWVKRLLLLNVAVFILTQLPGAGNLWTWLAFFPDLALMRPWSLVTYSLVHGGFMHLLFNMIGLFFFGPRLEERLGSRSFLVMYVLAAVGGAALHPIMSDSPVVGASGAVYGILVGFATFWPQARIHLWGILPVKAWILATVLVFGSLYAGATAGGDSFVAHFAHLGGALFGWLYVRLTIWRQGLAKRKFQQRIAPPAPTGAVAERAAVARWSEIDLDSLHAINREEVERLLAKAKDHGAGSLTVSELATLNRMVGRGG